MSSIVRSRKYTSRCLGSSGFSLGINRARPKVEMPIRKRLRKRLNSGPHFAASNLVANRTPAVAPRIAGIVGLRDEFIGFLADLGYRRPVPEPNAHSRYADLS